jgi:hypothetical protein
MLPVETFKVQITMTTPGSESHAETPSVSRAKKTDSGTWRVSGLALRAPAATATHGAAGDRIRLTDSLAWCAKPGDTQTARLRRLRSCLKQYRNFAALQQQSLIYDYPKFFLYVAGSWLRFPYSKTAFLKAGNFSCCTAADDAGDI